MTGANLEKNNNHATRKPKKFKPVIEFDTDLGGTRMAVGNITLKTYSVITQDFQS